MGQPLCPSAPIDHDHLARQTGGDRDLQAELLALFARQAQAIVATLDLRFAGPGQETREPATLAEAADLLHTLCGSARAVGSWRVAAGAAKLERTLRTRPSADVEGFGDDLSALGGEVRDACLAIAGRPEPG